MLLLMLCSDIVATSIDILNGRIGIRSKKKVRREKNEQQ